MTREELVKILDDAANFIGGKQYTIGELADRILAAIEKEREGEVVMWNGVARTTYRESVTPLVVEFGIALDGIKGQLIFRPAKGKGE